MQTHSSGAVNGAQHLPIDRSNRLGDLAARIAAEREAAGARGNGFRELYAWLLDRDFLIVRADRLEPLVVIPLRLAAEIAITAERQR
jgi:hypothetical protein